MTVKQQVVDARLKGATYSQITDDFGIAKSTAQGWVNAGAESVNVPKAYVNETFSRDKPSRFKKTEEDVLAFLSQLAPIKVSSSYKGISSSLSDYAVVGSDFHFGCQDSRAIEIFLETIDELKPATIILNGDTMDMLAISKYPKDLKHSWSLLDERRLYHEFLENLIGVAGGAKIYETTSNHSGSSVQGRWRRYLSDRIGELGSIPEITDVLSYENVFMGDYQNEVEHVDYVDLNGLVVTHGTTVRGSGGASCLGEVNKWGSSILHGHTHRIGSSGRRVPAMGKRGEEQLIGFEGGCLCSLDAAYGVAMNWNQGFNIVGLGDNTFSVEQVMINSGKANIATLGKTLYS